VAAELADRFAQLALLGTGAVDVELEVFDGLQRPEDVAVPAEPFEPCQLGGDAVGGRRRWGCAQALGELGQHGEAHRDVEPVQQVFGLWVEVEREVAHVVGAVGASWSGPEPAGGGQSYSAPETSGRGLER
jgi:hypothetical protein